MKRLLFLFSAMIATVVAGCGGSGPPHLVSDPATLSFTTAGAAHFCKSRRFRDGYNRIYQHVQLAGYYVENIPAAGTSDFGVMVANPAETEHLYFNKSRRVPPDLIGVETPGGVTETLIRTRSWVRARGLLICIPHAVPDFSVRSYWYLQGS
jgi:hypothetical protein